MSFQKEIKNSFQLLKNNLKSIIPFILIYSIINTILTNIIFKYALLFTLKISGLEFLSNTTFLPWLLNPFTIITLLCYLIILLFIIIIEVTSLTRVYLSHEKLTWYQMFYNGFIDTIKVLKIKNIKIIIFITLITPLTGNYIMPSIMKKLYLPSYISSYIINNPYLMLLCVFGYLLALYFSIKWAFSLYYFLFDNNSKLSIKSSNTVMFKHFFHIFLGKLFITISLFIVISLIGLIVGFFLILTYKLLFTETIGYNYALKSCFYLQKGLTEIYNILITPLLFAYLSTVFKEVNPSLELSSILIYPHHRTKLYHRLGIIIVITCFIANFIFLIYDSYNNYQIANSLTKFPLIMAHRGSSVTAPENTMPAFLQAIKDQADYIELDVHETKDGYLVVSHDSNLKRIANANVYIWNTNYQDLLSYDVGSSFSKEFENTHISTLEEVLKVTKDHIKINIELKPTKHDYDLAKKLVTLIKQYNATDDVIISSLNLSVLKEVHELNSNLKLFYISSIISGNLNNLSYLSGYSLEEQTVTESLVKKMHSENKLVYAWTINDSETVRKMAEYDVDAIITDDPVMAKSTLETNELEQDYFFLKYIYQLG